jgi:hypothetical protein
VGSVAPPTRGPPKALSDVDTVAPAVVPVPAIALSLVFSVAPTAAPTAAAAPSEMESELMAAAADSANEIYVGGGGCHGVP